MSLQEETLAKRRAALAKARMVKAANARASEQEALTRVRHYMAWLKAGSKSGQVPEIPSNTDFGIARRRGVVK